jgi:NADH-quinone oxidoreductase subunit C
MLKQELTDFLKNLFPEFTVREDTQLPELIVPLADIVETATTLKNNETLGFDYLISLTAVDFKDKFTMVYHLDSTRDNHVLVVKTDIADHDNPSVDSVSGVWKTAEFHEREVYDLFGIRFNGHTDLRRLFMDEDYGYPLRKDFKDENRVVTLQK